MSATSIYYKNDRVHDLFLPKSLITWILTHINCPITGFEHKTNRDGETLSYKEQISETQYQLILIASDYYRRGTPIQKIYNLLTNFLKDDC